MCKYDVNIHAVDYNSLIPTVGHIPVAESFKQLCVCVCGGGAAARWISITSGNHDKTLKLTKIRVSSYLSSLLQHF